MELDDLRRQWRQPEPVKSPASLSTAELTRLLARQSGSSMAKLRRNARLELGINYALLLVSGGLAALASALWLRLFGGLLALLAVVCIYYFYRKLGLLRGMDNPVGDLRGHLLRITQGMRTLIRFYYRLTLAMIPVTMLLCWLLALSEARSPVTLLKAGLVLGALAVLGLALYLPVGHATARYLQRLYGQHLDQLEGQLRELDDQAPASLR